MPFTHESDIFFFMTVQVHPSLYTRCPEELSLEPLKRDIRKTTRQSLGWDITAGFAVALLSIPQAIAYSISAGVPPIAGLLSTIVGTFIASLLGSSRHLIIGPNNATVVLVQTAACEIFATMYASHMSPEHRGIVTLELMIVLTMLIGLIQIVSSVFKLGRILQFVSYSVVIGYIAGSALAITVDQLFIATGIPCPDTLETLFQRCWFLVVHIQEAHILTGALTAISFLLLIFFRKNNVLKIIPASLLMLIVTSGCLFFIDLDKTVDASGKKIMLAGGGSELVIWQPGTHAVDNEENSSLVEQDRALISSEVQAEKQAVESVLVHPQVDFRLLNALIPVAFAIAFIGMLETNSIAKSIAVKSGQRITSSQDIFALGCSNFVLSFMSGLPCSGSMSRTATNYDSGAKTRFGGMFSACFVGGIVAFFGPCIAYLPQASLAAILLYTAPKMVDKKQFLLCLKATKSDALVILATFLSCIFFSLHLAFYMGVTLSIMLYLRKAATPRVVEYQYNEQLGELKPISEEEHLKPQLIRIINVEGELFFGAVDLFQYALRAMAEDDQTTKVIILRLKHVRDLDATAALALKQLKEYLDRKNRKLIISSVPPYVVRFLESSGLVNLIGRENIMVFDENDPHSSLERALIRAREFIGTGSNFRVENPT